jgi:hypothetical protein
MQSECALLPLEQSQGSFFDFQAVQAHDLAGYKVMQVVNAHSPLCQNCGSLSRPCFWLKVLL